MLNPKLEIDLSQIKNNANKIVQLAQSKGVEVFGVTKGMGGNIEVAKAMLEGGVVGLADSRLENLDRLKSLDIPLMLIRIPMLSQAKEVVQIAHISLNSQLEVIRRLNIEAARLNKVHKIILMIDLGDRREGILPEETFSYVKEIGSLTNIDLIGLGTNFACFRDVLPTADNMMELMDLVKASEKILDKDLSVISGGNSSLLPLLLDEGYRPITNQIRVGETIILGRKVPSGDRFPLTSLDTVKLKVEVIEIKDKPILSAKGIRRRAILAIGRQDVEPNGLIPYNSKIIIEGASSDHLIIDITNVEGVKIGDEVSFRLDYFSLLRAITSPYVSKVYY